MISDGFRFLCWSIISFMARLNISSEMIQILDYIRSTHTDEKCRTHGCDQPCFFFLFLFFLFLLFAPFLSFFLEHHQRCSPLWVLQEHLGLDRQGVLNGALGEQTRDPVGATICLYGDGCTGRVSSRNEGDDFWVLWTWLWPWNWRKRTSRTFICRVYRNAF